MEIILFAKSYIETSDMEKEIPIIELVNCCLIILADEEKKNGIESLNNGLNPRMFFIVICICSLNINTKTVYIDIKQLHDSVINAKINKSSGSKTNIKIKGNDKNFTITCTKVI
jgi:hypothetical protein